MAEARVLTEEERIERGLPKISGASGFVTGSFRYNDDGTITYRNAGAYRDVTSSIVGYDEDSIVIRYDTISGPVYTGIMSNGYTCRATKSVASGGGSSTDTNTGVGDGGACATAFKSFKGHIIISQNSHYFHSDGDSNTTSRDTTQYLLIATPGAGASPQDTRKHMKEAGIDVEGETIKVNKPMDTKDINADGKITTTGDIEAGGDIHGKGNETVDGKLEVKGSTVIGDDKNADKFDVYAQTHLHGDTTIGDDANDKFVVNATSEFKADATFDKNVTIHGDQTVDGSQTVGGDSHIKGNQSVDGDSVVGGNATVKGSMEINGDETVHGNSTVDGDSHTKGNAEVDKDLAVHGDAKVDGNQEIGKDLSVHGNATVDGNLTTKGDTYTLGNSVIGKDLTVGGDSHLGGDLILDGRFFAKGAAEFGDNLSIAKDLTVGGSTAIAQNLSVGGDAKVDGDIYARSFNIGNERYIDKDGINANNHKIRNVADGDIGPNSLDAVNGRQLYHTREALQHNIDQVGAATAAMASLHPLDYEHDDKLSVSAAMGNYKDKTAMAVGVFYRPNIKSMVNLSGTLGYGDNMFGIGVSTKMGKVTEEDNMTDEQLRDKVSEIHDENKELRVENGKLKSEVSDLKQEILKSHEQATAQENQIAALMSKVDGLVSELATLKAAQK